MESHIVTHVPAIRSFRDRRARAISLLGPLTSVGGILWAFVQPYRLTILHPRGQGFWWLVIEPPLLVAGAGILFAVLIAKPLLADLEGDDGAA